MKPNIRFARSSEDRLRVFRFRYAIYVEEMKRVQKHADPLRRVIEEPFDETGHLLLAESEGEIVGTVRTNFGGETDLGYYAGLFRMESAGASFPERVSLTTKMMIVPRLRSGTLAVRLAQAIFDFGRDGGIRRDFIDCNAHLESFFERMGYRRYMPKAVHPEYGEVLPLRLDIDDEAHLRSIDSPLAWRSRKPVESPLATPIPAVAAGKPTL